MNQRALIQEAPNYDYGWADREGNRMGDGRAFLIRISRQARTAANDRARRCPAEEREPETPGVGVELYATGDPACASQRR